MMKNVQQQKIRATIQLICKCNHQKNQFMKHNIPIQEQLIRKIEQSSNLTINVIAKLEVALKQQKEGISIQSQIYEKSSLHAIIEQPKPSDKRNINELANQKQWNNNIIRVLEAMSISHIAKQNALKNYYKLIDGSYQAITTQSMKYRVDVKNIIKQLTTIFHNIDATQKQQNKLLTKIVKAQKNQQTKQSIFYLIEIKKIQQFWYKEISQFIERNKKIYQFINLVMKNQKYICKKIKQILTKLFEKRKQILKQTSQDQKILGMLTILEEGVQQSRQSYLEKMIISKNAEERILWLIKPQKNKLSLVIKYLSIQLKEIVNKYDFFSTIGELGIKISFQYFTDVSLAQGWIITSYTPCIIYLTFDHYLAVFDNNGTLLEKIYSSSTVINKIQDNIVYLSETKKGFFKDSKQEYKIKFDNADRMDQFILFIENQIL